MAVISFEDMVKINSVMQNKNSPTFAAYETGDNRSNGIGT